MSSPQSWQNDRRVEDEEVQGRYDQAPIELDSSEEDLARRERLDDRLLSIDEDDLPALEEKAVESEVEKPSESSHLSPQQVLALNRMWLDSLPPPPPTGSLPGFASDGGPLSLYDWFVGAISLAPVCDALFHLVDRLSEWRHRPRRKIRQDSGHSVPREQPDDWVDPRNLRV